MGSGGVFATPVDLAREVASELLATGKVTPVWLGVEGHDLPADQSAALGVSGGAVIDKVYSPSPAAAGGLGNGDIVLGVNGRVVGSMAALVLAMRAFPSGSTLTLTVHQGSQVRGLLVTLTPRPTWAS
jgi:S1-C subfamily serine protease